MLEEVQEAVAQLAVRIAVQGTEPPVNQGIRSVQEAAPVAPCLRLLPF